MFTSQPQVVEVYRAGRWEPGELLGWRHDDSGACQVWVRTQLDGVAGTTWTDLASLRLPELGTEAPGRPSRAEWEESPRSAASSRPSVAVAVETTVSLPMARDHVGATPPRSGGRRRAPEVAVTAETRLTRAPSVPVPAPGRHRARSADPAAGRHRAVDTGLLPAVVDAPGAPASSSSPSVREFPDGGAWAVPAARSAPESAVPAGSAWAAPGEEMLTRPMRLTDAAPHARRPRLVAH